MITHKKKRRKNKLIVLDIENTPDGNVIDIDVCYRDGDGNFNHHVFSGWFEAWEFILHISKDSQSRTLYAHNGGGWDWLSLVQYLLKKDGYSITAIMAGSSMVAVTIEGDFGYRIRLCDSLNLLQSSLDKLSNQFLGYRKINLDGKLPHEIKATDSDTYYKYLRRDTESLLEILEKSQQLMSEHIVDIGSFPITIGATAMHAFRQGFLEQEIAVPWDEDIKNELRAGYYGGRVEVFKYGYFDSVDVYDINSLYPTVMLNEYPTSDRTTRRKNYVPGIQACWSGTVTQTRRDIPPVLCFGDCSDDENGRYQSSGSYYTPELELLREVDPDCIIDVQGIEFLDTGYPFVDWVNKIYALRLEHKGSAVDTWAKFLLNSLYGKFGQKPERDKIIKINSFDDLAKLAGNATIEPVDEESGLYKVTEICRCEHEHCGIAGMITSYARSTLYRGILDCWPNVAYVDTDSLHVVNGGVSNLSIGKNLGQWKLEFSGEGVYAGKKLYALRSEETEKVRCKGVSVGGRNGASINFDSIREIAENQGASVVAEFSRPATPKEVFAGKQSCKFVPRKRTVKRT